MNHDNKNLNHHYHKDELNSQIEKVLNLKKKLETQIHKNFCYSILDLNGNFIYTSSNSEQFFEFKPKDIKGKNLFDLMIPLSKQLLSTKFGQSLFQIPSQSQSLCF